MKLSEAMMLGAATCRMEAGNWNSCAIGAAGNAMGVPQGKLLRGNDRCRGLSAAWPWLWRAKNEFAFCWESVASRFDGAVCTGKMTLEELADYVRTIEPDCGECNRFECTCTPAVAEVSQLAEVAK